MIGQDQYHLPRSIPAQFSPFFHEYFIQIYMNILYVYTNISPAFILFIDIRPSIIPIFPCPLLSNFSSCSSQKRKDINVIYHLTITAGFQLNRSGLENKRTEAISFFPNLHNNNNGRRGWVLWVVEQRQRGWRRRKHVFICLPLLTLNSTHMHLRKRRETRKGLFPNTNFKS